jgi:hypothetical protein
LRNDTVFLFMPTDRIMPGSLNPFAQTFFIMVTETSNKEELLAAIHEAAANLQNLMSLLDEHRVNVVPYEHSWTAGQLFRHVAKSTGGMEKVVRADAKPAARDAGERIPELKKIFLDFSHKMKSPEFIVPEAGPYEKEAAMEELGKAFAKLKEAAEAADDLSGLATGLPLGPITKLELLHFVLYHTQRHTHQMKRICDALKEV